MKSKKKGLRCVKGAIKGVFKFSKRGYLKKFLGNSGLAQRTKNV